MRQNPEPVTVFETGNAAVLVVAKSLLESADIYYYAAGEHLLFPFAEPGLIGYAGSRVVRIQVSAEDAPDAKALLADLDPDPRPGEDGDR